MLVAETAFAALQALPPAPEAEAEAEAEAEEEEEVSEEKQEPHI